MATIRLNATVNFTASDIEELQSQECCKDEGENPHVFTWNVRGEKGEVIILKITVGDDE